MPGQACCWYWRGDLADAGHAPGFTYHAGAADQFSAGLVVTACTCSGHSQTGYRVTLAGTAAANPDPGDPCAQALALVVLAVFALAATALALDWVRFSFFPEGPNYGFIVTLEMPTRTPSERTLAKLEEIERRVTSLFKPGELRASIDHIDFQRVLTLQADIDKNKIDTLAANKLIKERWGQIRDRYPDIKVDFAAVLSAGDRLGDDRKKGFAMKRYRQVLLSLFFSLLAGLAEAHDLVSVYQQAAPEDPQLERAREALGVVQETQSQASAALFLPEASFNASVNQDMQNVLLSGSVATGESGRSNFMFGGYTLTLTQPILHYDRLIAWQQADSRIA